MPPEQHAGAALTAAADQYAFCVTAWILLTGRLPFPDGLGVDQLAALKRRGPPSPPPAIDVPRRAIRALQRGLEPDPDDRWPSMMALRRQLRSTTHRTWMTIVAASTTLVAAVAVLPPNPATRPVRWMDANTDPNLDTTRERSPALDAALVLVRDGKTSSARALLAKIFEDAGARGALSDVAESAAWIALLTPSFDRATIAEAARDADVVVRNIDASPRVRALAELASARADDEHEAPEVGAQRASDAISGIGDPLVAHMGERHVAMFLRRAGRFVEALEHLDRAETLAEAANSPSLIIEARIERSQLLGAAGRNSEARAQLDALLREVEVPGPRAHILAHLAEEDMSAGDLEGAAAHFAEARALLETQPEPDMLLTLRCLLLESELQQMRLELDEALATLERARVIAESTRGGQDRSLLVIHLNAAQVLETQGDVGGALEHLDAALSLSEAAGNAFDAAGVRVELARVLADDGQLARAQRHADEAAGFMSTSDDPQGRYVYETVLAKIREQRGDRAGALEHFRMARRWFETTQGPAHPVAGMLLSEEARLGGLLGEETHDRFEDAIAIQRHGGAPPMIYAYSQIAYAQYLWCRGRRSRAIALLEEALPHARQHPGPPAEYAAALAWIAEHGVEIDD